MNPAETNHREAQRQALLGQLNAAEASLRLSLGMHRLEAIARAHVERALAHVREACMAINEAGHARTVEQLGNDLLNVELLSNQVHLQSVRV